MTFERKFEVEILFRARQHIVYEIRLIAIREVSPPFGEDRASTAVEKTISSTEHIVRSFEHK